MDFAYVSGSAVIFNLLGMLTERPCVGHSASIARKVLGYVEAIVAADSKLPSIPND
jgi:hypothetical protein